jgi:hypothetical protein
MAKDSLVDDVERIAGLDEDPVLRNLLITQCYHDLSQGLNGLFGRDNANWCTFATWASKTAGKFIRKEQVPGQFRETLDQPELYREPLEAISLKLDEVSADAEVSAGAEVSADAEVSISTEGSVSTEELTFEALELFEIVDVVVENISQEIAEGNIIVFAEIGRLFSEMIQTFKDDKAPDQAKLEAFLSRYREGATGKGGQSTLRSAAGYYYRAMFEGDLHRKAELMLLANAQVGLHEQMRLQPYIVSSIDAPVDAVTDLVTQSLSDFLNRTGRSLEDLDELVKPIVDKVRELWQEFSTELLMTLELPDGVLHLGRDLPSPPGQPLYPKALRTIRLPELLAMIRQFDPEEDVGGLRGFGQRLKQAFRRVLVAIGVGSARAIGSEAANWTRLTDRMRYIIQLFRSRQQDGGLFSQPFSDEQRAAILDGRMPDGPL